MQDEVKRIDFFLKSVERCRSEKYRQGAIPRGNKEKWGVKRYIHRLFWQRPVASSYTVDSQSLARYKRGQGAKYINGPATALDGVIIGWETGLTLQFHELLSWSLMPFSENLHGKDQVIASHWPGLELDTVKGFQCKECPEKEIQRKTIKDHCPSKLKTWNEGNSTFGKSGHF